jgi:hypothetical protein
MTTNLIKICNDSCFLKFWQFQIVKKITGLIKIENVFLNFSYKSIKYKDAGFV